MSVFFLHNLEAIFSWILAASWQASVLALLVLAFQFALGPRLNPRWRYALWLLVLVRLVLPALPESALSLFQFAPPAPASLIDPVTEPLFVATPLPASTPSHDLPPVDPSYPFSFYSLLAVVWLAGATALLLITWHVNRRFARQIANSPEIADPELLNLFATAKTELGVRRSIRLIENSQVQSPAIMGLFRPTLLLPANVRDKFDARELRFIFLHELAHLKRGDVIAQALIALLQIVHWFNPVLWFAFRRMRIDREPATDALVLSRTGEDEKERYGLMLIKLLEHFNQRHSLPTLVGILEDKDQFKRRFSLIARFTRGAYGWSLLGIFLIGALAIACLTKSKSNESSAKNLKPAESEYAAHIAGLGLKPDEKETMRKAFAAADAFISTMDARPTIPESSGTFDDNIFKIHADVTDIARATDRTAWPSTVDVAHSHYGEVQSRHLKSIGRSGPSQGVEFLHDASVTYETIFQKGPATTTMLEVLSLHRTPTYDPQGQWKVWAFSMYEKKAFEAARTSQPKLTGWVDTPAAPATDVTRMPKFDSTLTFGKNDETKPSTTTTSSAPDSTAPSTDMVILVTKVIQIGESDYQAHQGEINAAVQKGDVAALSGLNPKSFHLIADLSGVFKIGERGVIESVRVLSFPGIDMKDSNGNLVPKDSRRANLGVRFVSKSTIANDAVQVEGHLQIRSLEGWSMEKDGIPQAHYHERELSSMMTFPSSHTWGLEVPGGAQMEPLDPKLIFGPDKTPSSSENPKTLARYFVVFNVTLYTPDGKPVLANPMMDTSAPPRAGANQPPSDIDKRSDDLTGKDSSPNVATRQQDLLAAKEDADARQVLLDNVKNLPDEKFLSTLHGLGRDDPAIIALQNDIDNRKSDIENLLKDGFAEDHPRIQDLRAALAVKQQRMKDLVDGTRKAMTIDSQMAASRVTLLAKELNDQKIATTNGQPEVITPSALPPVGTVTTAHQTEQIQISLKVVEINDDVYLANQEKIDTAVDKADIGFFIKMEGVSLLSTPSVSTQSGTKANVDIVREFAYPTEFDPGKIVPHATMSVQGGGTTNASLAIPPTPREFKTKDIGVSAEITPSIDDGNSPDHGKIILNGKFTVTDFAGFTKSNLVGASVTPSFNTSESLFLEALDNNQEKSFWIPGEHVALKNPTTADFTPDWQKTAPMIKKRYLLFVSAKLVK